MWVLNPSTSRSKSPCFTLRCSKSSACPTACPHHPNSPSRWAQIPAPASMCRDQVTATGRCQQVHTRFRPLTVVRLPPWARSTQDTPRALLSMIFCLMSGCGARFCLGSTFSSSGSGIFRATCSWHNCPRVGDHHGSCIPAPRNVCRCQDASQTDRAYLDIEPVNALIEHATADVSSIIPATLQPRPRLSQSMANRRYVQIHSRADIRSLSMLKGPCIQGRR